MGHCVRGCGETKEELMSDGKTFKEICTACLNNQIEYDGKCLHPTDDEEELGKIMDGQASKYIKAKDECDGKNKQLKIIIPSGMKKRKIFVDSPSIFTGPKVMHFPTDDLTSPT